jgi:hypothetical protein
MNYTKQLACTKDGIKLSVSQTHAWTGDELDATYLLPCKGFATEPDATMPLHPYRVQPDLDAAKPREHPIADNVVALAATEIACERGHKSKDTSLQRSHLTYEGNCTDCGGPVTLHATLKRKA